MSVRVRVEEVIVALGADGTDLLVELRREGLFEADELDDLEAEELRVAACWVRDLGVNAAGVGVALQLRRRLLVLEDRVRELLEGLLEKEAPR
jgi:hypothetical protein